MWLADANYTAAAVNAGGMGFLTAKTFPDPTQFKDELEKALSLTSGKPIGVNLYQSMRAEENEVLEGHLKINQLKTPTFRLSPVLGAGERGKTNGVAVILTTKTITCLLYTSDAADE